MEKHLESGTRNGVGDLQRLTGEEARALEPHLQCVAAIFSPSTGIIDSHRCANWRTCVSKITTFKSEEDESTSSTCSSPPPFPHMSACHAWEPRVHDIILLMVGRTVATGLDTPGDFFSHVSFNAK